jgi:hypothetical protein
MYGKQSSIEEVEREFADVINQSRRRVESGSVEADRVGALLRVMESSFTEGSLVSAVEDKIKVEDNLLRYGDMEHTPFKN